MVLLADLAVGSVAVALALEALAAAAALLVQLLVEAASDRPAVALAHWKRRIKACETTHVKYCTAYTPFFVFCNLLNGSF